MSSLIDAKAALYLELQQTSKAKYTEADVEIREVLLKDPEMRKVLTDMPKESNIRHVS